MLALNPYPIMGMVNMLSWNVRGLNGPNKHKEVKLLCSEEHVGLVGLLETKIKSKKIDQVADKLFGGWSYTTNLVEHYNGRIWIIWRPDYHKVNTIDMTTQHITCEVFYIPLQLSFALTFVYAFNTREERRGLWSNLVTYHRGCQKAWIILGDFNLVLRVEDRIGGNPITWADVVDFHTCIEECELIEFPHAGSKYTWNDKGSNQRIFSKLDWIFINNKWLDTMPSCRAMYLPEGISDHCPAKITWMTEELREKKQFHYCNVWAQHPNFTRVVH
ncbi:hypothetical protein KY289_013458 [Solanum tuberosum]|nr:hypothetical protein KY289_013458 [Solanum tuberosum]